MTSSDFNYWEDFKTRKPTVAKEIEQISGRNMSRLDSSSAHQVVNSLTRWSQNANVPIRELKVYFLGEVTNLLAKGVNYEILISKLKNEKINEARKFGISPDFTISNFMIEFIDEDRQKKSSNKLLNQIGKNLNMTPDKFEQFAKSVENKVDELNIAPDISGLDREENKLFALAEEGARMLDNLPLGPSNNVKLSQSGFAEARILCSTIVIDLHSNFQNEIDLDDQTDRYFLLLTDASMFDIEGTNNIIGFLNSRIAFYKEQVSIVKFSNILQLLQPDGALAKIFSTIYLHPECEHPENIKPDEVSTNDIIKFKVQFEKVVRHLKFNRNKICGNQTGNDSDILQSEIEEALMLLFPESKRAQVNQSLAYLLTSTILAQLKSGSIKPSITASMPSEIRIKFSQLASKIQKYSVNHNDIETIIEEAQTNIVNKFQVL
jgi:hypothetical protein